jgi:hypothetical protein
MSRPLPQSVLALALIIAAALLSGCVNPDAPTATTHTQKRHAPQNAGEPRALAPLSPQAEDPAAVKATVPAAISTFAELYTNWTYRTLSSNQRALAGMAVGSARLSEQQAASSAQDDGTIARGHIYNRGQLVSIAPDRERHGWWVIVTLEQTGGSTQYQGLPASYHVTLAQLAHVTDGYAVKQWLPQS